MYNVLSMMYYISCLTDAVPVLLMLLAGGHQRALLNLTEETNYNNSPHQTSLVAFDITSGAFTCGVAPSSFLSISLPQISLPDWSHQHDHSQLSY